MLTNCDRSTEELVTQTTTCNNKLNTKMLNLVKNSAAKDGLINLKGERNISDIFPTFVNYCLINLTTSVIWRYRAYNTIISENFTA